MPDIKAKLMTLSPVYSPMDILGWHKDTPVTADIVFNRIDAWGNLLKDTPGERCALYLHDTIEFICAMVASLREGKTVYLSPNTLPVTCAALARTVDVYLGEFPAEYSPQRVSAVSTQREQHECGALTIPAASEIVVFTSGSTGEAQAIRKQVWQLRAEVETLTALFGSIGTKSADIVSTVSHQHIYGLLFKVFFPLHNGNPIYAANVNFPEELIVATSERDAILLSSPAHLARFVESDVWQKADHRVRAIFSSGGTLTHEVSRKVAASMKTAPVEIYGSSETGGIAWRRYEEGSDGGWTPFPDIEWRIGEGSVIEIRSDRLQGTNWFGMADRIIPIDRNRFLLDGRADHIVKIEEKRVSLSGMERKLSESALVLSARVIPVEQHGRKRLAAFIVLAPEGRKCLDTDGKLSLNRQLRDTLLPAFERVTCPKIWRYLDELPVNAQGKTTYSVLGAMLDSGASQFPESSVLHRDEQHVRIALSIPATLVYFEGHFSGVPILPGVVQVDWAIFYARQYFDFFPNFHRVEQLKFRNPIKPDAEMHLELLCDPGRSLVQFRYFSHDTQYASGKILFTKPF